MDPARLAAHLNLPRPTLLEGEFAPVYWEPLGRRAERLVVGFLLAPQDQPAHAYRTLEHKRLLEFVSEGRSQSADGILDFAFAHFNKTLTAGGIIADLRPPFESMSIGLTERISARDNEHLLQRALRLCTLLGQLPDKNPKPDGGMAAAKTLTFLRDVRQLVRAVNPGLARSAMNTRQTVKLGRSEFRTHFQHEGHFAQFCSLPLPNARLETATECAARLAELAIIRNTMGRANVALCINTQALQAAQHWQGGSRRNATLTVLNRTLDGAAAFKIPVNQWSEPRDAARFLREFADSPMDAETA